MLFCSDPLNERQPDEAYAREVSAVREAGLHSDLVNFEALVFESDPVGAVRRVAPMDVPETAVFRGWMMTPDQYGELYVALQERGMFLVNTPVAYQHCHYLPESYAVIEGCTPDTVWLETDASVSIDRLMILLLPFGSVPVIVKDYVKSRKHDWNEACLISSATDRREVERVVGNFLRLQGDNFQKGIVFRKYVELEALTAHSKSGMPLAKEYRLFFLDGQLVSMSPYWNEGQYDKEQPPLDIFRQVAAKVNSRFFTMDIAKCTDGTWTIIELGDGQVAELPERVDAKAFYDTLILSGL